MTPASAMISLLPPETLRGYGTSVDSRKNVGYEIDVSKPEAMAAAGVRKPTRFVCARRIIVTVDHPGRDLNPRHATPVIGRLAPEAMERMNAIRARIHAARDIIADRRAAKRRPFTVEHRRGGKIAFGRREVQS